MDAVKFLKEKERICRKHDCFGCPIGTKTGGCAVGFICNWEKTAEEVVAIVEKWSNEHPIQTRQSEFLKMFPNAKLNDAGYVSIFPCHLCEKIKHSEMCKKYGSCSDCRKDYWFAEVE